MRTYYSVVLLSGLLLAALAAEGCSAKDNKDGAGVTLGPGEVPGADGSYDEVYTVDDDTGFTVDTATLSSPPDVSAEAFWADDPPPKTCGAGSGVTPKPPGGTPECPDDKNRQGCDCSKEGEEAPCWPGLRKNRNRGVCKDGKTTCIRSGERTLKWGECKGYVLPTGTTGKAACTCFSGGKWDLANTSPCFIMDSTGKVTAANSSMPTYDSTGKVTDVKCQVTKPTVSWSKTTLTVDCSGHFKLCYTIKAGDAKAVKTTDCVVTSQCAEGDYTTPNVAQKWAELPAWETKDVACAQKFWTSGGYGELSVDGTSIECDKVTKVFQTTPFCPAKCAATPPPDVPECKGCGTGGGGSF